MEMEIWEKPQMNEVEFAANEYVTVCSSRVAAPVHAHGITKADHYRLYVDSNGSNRFEYDEGIRKSDVYESSIYKMGSNGGVNSEGYFNHMKDTSHDVDQLIYFWNLDAPGGEDTVTFQGCKNADAEWPENETNSWFTGWWADGSGNLLGKAQVWWDQQIHATFAAVSHS